MATFGDTIKTLRESRGLTQFQLGRALGITDKAISTWENNVKVPRMGTILGLSDYFGVTVGYLMGYEDTEKKPAPLPHGAFIVPTVPKPLLGNIICGKPEEAIQQASETVEVPAEIHCDFCLRAHGDSMTGARIRDGDIVYIRSQPDVESGEIAAVMVNSDEATLKRVRKIGNVIMLCPENPDYEPLMFMGEQLTDVRIIGKAVGFTSIVL